MTLVRDDFTLAIRLAYRSRLTSIALWLIGALVVVVLLAAQFSARQPATVALDVGLSFIRLALPLFSILLVQELFTREFERKLYLSSFTYPRNRLYWLLGRIVAIIALTLIVLAVMAAILALLTLWTQHGYSQSTPVALDVPYLVTLGFIAVDLLVVITMATLLAMSAITPSFVLIGTLGFIIIARSYTPVIELLRTNPNALEKIADPHLYQDSLGMIAFLLPDLGRLDVRMIALYDKMAFLPNDWPLLLAATLAYVVALLGAASWILNKREFT